MVFVIDSHVPPTSWLVVVPGDERRCSSGARARSRGRYHPRPLVLLVGRFSQLMTPLSPHLLDFALADRGRPSRMPRIFTGTDHIDALSLEEVNRRKMC